MTADGGAVGQGGGGATDHGGAMRPSTFEGLWMRIEQVEADAASAHRRLRADLSEDLSETKTRVESNYAYFQQSKAATDAHLAALEARPVDAGKISLTPGMVAAIVAVCLTVAGSAWTFAYGGREKAITDNAALRSDVRDILTRLDAQRDSSRAEADARRAQAAALESQLNAMKDALAVAQKTAGEAKNNFELLRYDFMQFQKDLNALKKGADR